MGSAFHIVTESIYIRPSMTCEKQVATFNCFEAHMETQLIEHNIRRVSGHGELPNETNE